jgi:flagellar biosynthesis/type III secretory pathway chaperone
MQPTPVDVTTASNILDKEISALEAVMQVLDSEHDALEARDAEALTAASQLKLQCIDTARRIGVERAELLPKADAIAANADISLRWEKLAKLAHGCKQKNERNGMLIRWQHKYIEQTLALLRNDGADSTLYGPDGGSKRNGGRRGTLGSA